ncbi:hypothetical protein SAMN05660236_4413 [Ohtaekwangia koreensis]|uniref:Uncharacterized protein n=1 Tax=Ohtaekwangia koreensis TaxID=688867 RepID=A0A1T5M514_9BACT|nr:hypothetical protein SAMN05660236_4413 [Ohtaekwangia koreensis]
MDNVTKNLHLQKWRIWKLFVTGKRFPKSALFDSGINGYHNAYQYALQGNERYLKFYKMPRTVIRLLNKYRIIG